MNYANAQGTSLGYQYSPFGVATQAQMAQNDERATSSSSNPVLAIPQILFQSHRHMQIWIFNMELELKYFPPGVPGIPESCFILDKYNGDLKDCPLLPSDLLSLRSLERAMRYPLYLKYLSLAMTFWDQNLLNALDRDWLWEEMVISSIKLRAQESLWCRIRQSDGTWVKEVQDQVFSSQVTPDLLESWKNDPILAHRGGPIPYFRDAFQSTCPSRALAEVCNPNVGRKPFQPSHVPNASAQQESDHSGSESTSLNGASVDNSEVTLVREVITIPDNDKAREIPGPSQTKKPHKVFPKSQEEIEIENAWKDRTKKKELRLKSRIAALKNHEGHASVDKYAWQHVGRQQLPVKPWFFLDPAQYPHDKHKGAYKCSHQCAHNPEKKCLRMKCSHACCTNGVDEESCRGWIHYQERELKRAQPNYVMQLRKKTQRHECRRNVAEGSGQKAHGGRKPSKKGKDKAKAKGNEEAVVQQNEPGQTENMDPALPENEVAPTVPQNELQLSWDEYLQNTRSSPAPSEDGEDAGSDDGSLPDHIEIVMNE